MADAIRHRGPDDGGAWVNPAIGLALGQRRLSILDLSPAGHQPMLSRSGRYVIVFNGEIYNHLELRADLPGETWRGGSDTETLLAAIERWGLDEALRRSVGMFALAVWDEHARRLSLARDRMGEKPLYYGWNDGRFIFASELKSFHAAPGFKAVVDRDALALYLTYGYVPAPWSIFEGVRKLEPGVLLTLDLVNGAPEEIRQYWSLQAVFERQPFAGSDEDAVDVLEEHLRRAIKLQMIADVPVGAFLSGGVDSSVVVALMQQFANRPVKTFSIGFEEAEYNEAPYAAKVAEHLGTEHTELMLSSQDVLNVVPRIPEVWDEPFADSSQIPTLILSGLAKRNVTVSLSGDGGDELFWGYNSYHLANRVRTLPGGNLIGRTINGISLARLSSLSRSLPAPLRKTFSPDRLRVLANYAAASDTRERYEALFVRADHCRKLMIDGKVSAYDAVRVTPPPHVDLNTAISAIDAAIYLPDDILVKVDRAAMAHSLETRAPLLDHRLVEFAFSLNFSLKYRDKQTKWPLRQVLFRHVPRALIERPKKGFSVPLGEWLRGPLRTWASDLLLRDCGSKNLINSQEVTQLWQDHQNGRADNGTILWRILMFRAWSQRYGQA